MAEENIKGWLTETYDYERPKRGQLLEGVILQIGEQGISVDVGLKRDGLVPNKDLERLEQEETELELKPGKEVKARVLRPEDRDGNLLLSLSQALSEKDWDKAEELLESDQVWQGKVKGYNRGGLIVQFGRLRGFVPGSHLWKVSRSRLSSDRRKETFQEYIGQEMSLKVIEVKRDRRRLVLSERLARRQMRKKSRKRLLEELEVGQVVKGKVSHLAKFGAFVDLGGADGLVHISELSWQHVKHPSEVVQVGDEVDVQVIRLDHERKRIALSMKSLQPNPWDWVDLSYVEGQLVSGIVTNVVDFGAFVALETGVEGLVHVSELANPPPQDPREVVKTGDELVLRILDVDSARHRIGLSLKRVADWEREDWLAQQEQKEAEEKASEEPAAKEPETQAEEPEAQAQEAEAQALEAQAEEPEAQAQEAEAQAPEAQAEEPEAQAQEAEAQAPEAQSEETQPAAPQSEDQSEESDDTRSDPDWTAKEPSSDNGKMSTAEPDTEREEIEPELKEVSQ